MTNADELVPENSVFEWALEFGDGLPERIVEPLRDVRTLYTPVLGMLYNVAQRLIDAKQRGAPSNPPDEALILLCNRIFNEAFAGYLLLSRGMLGPAQHNLRATMEATNLAILMLARPEEAERWLSGREYSPGDVRRLLNTPDDSRRAYAYLSKLTHANREASRTSVFPIPGGERLAYGGYLAPRATALNALAFVYLPLPFLRLFYDVHRQRLDALGLLWKPDLLPLVAETGATWGSFFDLFDELVRRIEKQVRSLPLDDAGAEALPIAILDNEPDGRFVG